MHSLSLKAADGNAVLISVQRRMSVRNAQQAYASPIDLPFLY